MIDLSHLPAAVFEGLPRSVRRFSTEGPRDPYFFLPCPICAEFFGGYEWGDIDGHIADIPDGTESGGKGICPNCTVEGRGCKAREITCDGMPHVAVVNEAR